MIVQRHGRRSSMLFVGIIFALSCVFVESISMTLNVDRRSETCLALPTPPNEVATITGSFELIDEEEELSAAPLRIVIYNPQGATVYSSANNADNGRFHAKGKGKFRLCVENGASKSNPSDARKADIHSRQVGLSVRVKSELLQQMNAYQNNKNNEKSNNNDNRDTLTIEERRHLEWESEQEIEKLQRTQRIVELTEELSEKMEALDYHLNYLKVRHSIHEDISDQTFGRVIKWNVVSGLALVCMSVGQIMAIRKVVEKRRFM